MNLYSNSTQPVFSWGGFLLLSIGGISVLFIYLNPESSQGLSLLGRTIYWSLHTAFLIGLMQTAQLAMSSFRSLGGLPPIIQVVLAGVIGAGLFTPVGVGLDVALPTAVSSDDLTQSPGARLLDEFLAIAPPASLTWVGLNAVRLLRLPDRNAPPLQSAPIVKTAAMGEGERVDSVDPLPPEGHAPQTRDPQFFERLPATLGRDLVALTAELHYLRVQTSAGNTLILFPFGQAVAELSAADRGMQIHRSHWVAAKHVVGVRRQGERLFCVLESGAALPVSRRREAEALERFPKVDGARFSR